MSLHQVLLSESLSMQGDVIAAEKWFLKALRLQPHNSDAHFHFGETMFVYVFPCDVAYVLVLGMT